MLFRSKRLFRELSDLRHEIRHLKLQVRIILNKEEHMETVVERLEREVAETKELAGVAVEALNVLKSSNADLKVQLEELRELIGQLTPEVEAKLNEMSDTLDTAQADITAALPQPEEPTA